VIQRPERGEVVVDVPGKGPLVDFHSRMQRVFGNRLISGRVVEDSGVRAIEWRVPVGGEVAPASSEAVSVAGEELLRCASEADAAAKELGDILRRATGASDTVRVSKDLARRIGATGETDFVLFADTELRPIRDALERTASAVRRAIARGNFLQADGSAKLYGWGFLPPQSDDFKPTLAGTVTLERTADPCDSDRPVEALQWKTTGSFDWVELVRIDGAEAVVLGTHISVAGNPATDHWRFPPNELPSGACYLARAGGKSIATTDSNIVEILRASAPTAGGVVLPPEPPTPKPSGPPAPPVAVGGTVVIPEPPLLPPPPARRGCWPWLWWLLWLLLFLLLLWLLGWLIPALGALLWSILSTLLGCCGGVFPWILGWWRGPTLPFAVTPDIRNTYPTIPWGYTIDDDTYFFDDDGTTWVTEGESGKVYEIRPGVSPTVVTPDRVPPVPATPHRWKPIAPTTSSPPPNVVVTPSPVGDGRRSAPTPPVGVSPTVPPVSPLPARSSPGGDRELPEVRPVQPSAPLSPSAPGSNPGGGRVLPEVKPVSQAAMFPLTPVGWMFSMASSPEDLMFYQGGVFPPLKIAGEESL